MDLSLPFLSKQAGRREVCQCVWHSRKHSTVSPISYFRHFAVAIIPRGGSSGLRVPRSALFRTVLACSLAREIYSKNLFQRFNAIGKSGMGTFSILPRKSGKRDGSLEALYIPLSCSQSLLAGL
jgi:hypothetical protein